MNIENSQNTEPIPEEYKPTPSGSARSGNIYMYFLESNGKIIFKIINTDLNRTIASPVITNLSSFFEKILNDDGIILSKLIEDIKKDYPDFFPKYINEKQLMRQLFIHVRNDMATKKKPKVTCNKLKKLRIEDLEEHFHDKNNLILKYMRYWSTQFDGFYEWNLQAILQILAIMSDRKVSMEFRQVKDYTNLYMLSVGISSISRKTVALSKAAIMLTRIGKNKISDDFTPERFIEEISTDPKSYFWKDEAAMVFAGFRKPYMEGIRSLITYLYDCPGHYVKNLRTTEKSTKATCFEVNNVFLNIWMITNPDDFRNYVTFIDAKSGYLMRFLILIPDLSDKPDYMEIEKKSEKDIAGFIELSNEISDLSIKLSRYDKIELEFSDDAMKAFRAWARAKHDEIMKSGEESQASLNSRMETNLRKIAMLIHISNEDTFPSLQGFNINSEKLKQEISEDDVKTAMWLIDDYFYPHTLKALRLISDDKGMQAVERLKSIIANKGSEGITKREFLIEANISVKIFDEAINTLIARGDVEIKPETEKYYYN